MLGDKIVETANFRPTSKPVALSYNNAYKMSEYFEELKALEAALKKKHGEDTEVIVHPSIALFLRPLNEKEAEAYRKVQEGEEKKREALKKKEMEKTVALLKKNPEAIDIYFQRLKAEST